ncbi:uncharacterized protein BCR38DRAFT_434928 [Pseudomassariella vexata]|uniref:Uncharacterized protein n=1 Tax=Pseudomassariella vexata TaxID=1141098 RepID=A0A1Y2DZ52_9PEZI|nr:uncharacterized protein BCR38DRAFT_434928 [Pseudomassariella vexata]ORY64374.1 hypothetical protein BCR38DRAFT_434928 [Pseudomassariella vexata]
MPQPQPNGGANASSGSSSAPAPSDADLAQAFKDLTKGEQQAAALERNLTSLESKLDALLAQFEDAAKEAETGKGKDEAPETTDRAAGGKE